jgi:ectoine hydroxylase-related dioxygenase (phytanoyl-CoA dioxygenase family)
MSISKYLSDFVRSFKITYTISNLFNYSKLKGNAVLYKKYGLKKSVISPISSKDFKQLPQQPQPWLDEKSLKDVSGEHAEFQSFPQNIQESIINWSEDGYAILPGFFAKEADEVNRVIKEKLKSGALKFRYGNKIMFALNQSELIRKMGNDVLMTKILSFLLGKEVKLFQSINFIEGSKQRAHSDIVHMTTFPQGYLIAIWIALEDIKEEQGALFYYPGSHKLPYILNDEFNSGSSYFRLGANSYKAYEDRIEDEIKTQGLQKKVLEAKKGDVLIWHANLLHGGSAITKPGSTRKSMVFHYYADGVICYHEITQRPALF